MTTFNDDMVKLHLNVETVFLPCAKLGLEWPPPPKLYLEGALGLRPATDDDDPAFVLICTSVSEITDAERAEMTHVFRGAEYYYAIELAEVLVKEDESQ